MKCTGPLVVTLIVAHELTLFGRASQAPNTGYIAATHDAPSLSCWKTAIEDEKSQ
jgi:hypothetical protein